MKKVINITLGNIVFAIEHEAYDTLAVYLEAIKSKLHPDEDATEIVSDIESAIAEKFVARSRSEKVAVTEVDVNAVISEMGAPADFGDEQTPEASEHDHTTEQDIKKRLYRDTDDVIVAGVASGMAQYFDIDPVIVRVLFVVAAFFNGFGILAYIVLWLVVPAAETTTQKYAMRGENVTLKDITERVKKNLNDLDINAAEKANGFGSTLRRVLVRLFEIVGVVVRVCVKGLRYIFGLIFVLGGTLGMAGLTSAYGVILLSDRVLVPAEAQTAVDILLSSMMGIVAIGASFVMMMIPLMVVILGGVSLLARRNYFTVPKTVSLFVVWVIALVLAFTTSALQVEKVMHATNSVETYSEQTIHIDDTGIQLEQAAGQERAEDRVPAGI